MAMAAQIVAGLTAYLMIGFACGVYALPRVMRASTKGWSRYDYPSLRRARKDATYDALAVMMAWPIAVPVYAVRQAGLGLIALLDRTAPQTEIEREAERLDRDARIARMERAELSGQVVPRRSSGGITPPRP